MAGLRQLLIDAWSFLNYKSTYDNGLLHHRGLAPYMAPGWVPQDDERRLRAYKMYESYYRITGREWLDMAMPESERRLRREYGDPFVITETALSSLLGDKQTIVTEGSVLMEQNPATAQQLILQEWADQEKFTLKLWECERNACKLGDGVYVLGWDPNKGRPRLSVYDPGMFFPILNNQHLSVEDFPNIVNIAYEFMMKVNGVDTPFVRRIQWSLEPTEAPRPSLPWGSAPQVETCVMSDGYWPLDALGKDPFVFDDSKATWLIEPTDLGIDFIPVVHVPCFVAGQEFWSHPVMSNVMQLFDDIAATDTDLQAAGSTTGSPAIAVSGATLRADKDGNVMTYGPGQVMEVGDGNATVIDTSQGLMALNAYKNELLERLSVNGRTPEALLGRVKPSEVPSGIALALGFSQHTNMIREMRMSRDEKYQTLFKFVWRFFQMAGLVPAEMQYIKTSLKMGSYLPSDKEQVMSFVVQGLNSKAISLETAVTMLIDAGYPIQDATEEVLRIRSTDFVNAQMANDATGDMNEGRAYLGLPPLSPADMPDPNADPNAE